MIHERSRAFWIGASDTRFVMGSWDTDGFRKWWAVKLGKAQCFFQNKQMRAGVAYEHRILDHLGITQKDRQIKRGELRLRVNLDGEDKETVYEVKTHGSEHLHISSAIWQQCQVEHFVTGKPVEIVAYRMTEAEYENHALSIDESRIRRYPIESDDEWIREKYLPRLRFLADCLKKRCIPVERIF